MAYLPIALPPGFYRNGPDYSAKDRWKAGNLVRFKDGKPRAIGGWARRKDTADVDIPALYADATLEASRVVFGWRDNLGGRHIAVGTTLHLFVIDGAGVVLDITPSSFTPGTKDSTLIDGYGIGPYGAEEYGRARSGSGLISAPVGSWALDAWGEDLLAAGPLGPNTELYAYTPGSGVDAAVVSGAPSPFNDFLVTDQRIVMCVGTGANQRGVAWSASENRTVWTPAVTNQAGSLTLAGYGALLAVDRVGSDILIVGERDAHVGRYIGPPYVYGFERVGDDCGCINAASVVVTDAFAMWFTGRDFYIYDGVAKTVPCEVADWLIQDMDYAQRTKMSGFVNSEFFELTWFYQSYHSTTGEPDSYITFNYLTKEWTTGRMDRTCGLDRGITRDNIYMSPEGYVFNSEIAGTLPDDTPYIISGPIEIGNGDNVQYLDALIGAEAIPEGTTAYLHCRDFPSGPLRTTGPFAVKPGQTIVKGYGRQVEIELQSNGDAVWTLGNFRLNIKVGGKW